MARRIDIISRKGSQLLNMVTPPDFAFIVWLLAVR
jgi:hypothetical protein